jgi:two-component system phosphate regulon sensor histidine kinase PhoR
MIFRRNPLSVLLVYLIYLLAIAMTTALLVFWVVVVQRFREDINQLISRLGVEWPHFHWFVNSTGAALFFLVLVALTYLLGVSLSELRYSKKREEFLASVTHDLKSPVAAIKLHAQTLEQGVDADTTKECAGYIVREADRIAGLVDNLLESSRLQSGAAARDLEPIHLGEFFREYQKAVRGRFDLSQVDLNFEIKTRAVVIATTDTLQRIMDNLIDNALRFTGGEIYCQVSDGAESTAIVVGDNGVGIPKRELGRIFNRFYRLRYQVGRKTARGTGLGLAIVRALVEEMRGSIRAVSGDGLPGTRFEIELPQAGDVGAEKRT